VNWRNVTENKLPANKVIRSLGIFERTLTLSDQHLPFNVVSALRLNPAPAPQVVQRALTILQNRHPLLRAYIQDGTFRESSSPLLLLDVVESQDDHLWQAISEREMNARLNAAEGLFRGIYIYNPLQADLILTFSHTIMDATSGVHLLDELLRLCADVNLPPLSPLGLVPPAEKLFPRSVKGLPGALKMFNYALGQMAEEIHYQWHVRGRRKPTVHLGGRGFSLSLTLNESLTDRLSKRCRTEQVTLNSMLNASLLLAVNRTLYGQDERLMQTMTFANLRPYLALPISAENLSCYITMLRYTIAVSGNVWFMARDLHGKILGSFKRGAKFMSFKASAGLMKMILSLKSMRLCASALTYSGVLPLAERYGEFQIESIHGFISSFDLGPEVSAHALLFKDRLQIDFMFLETDMSRETAGNIVNEVKAILEKAGSG